MAIVRCLEDVDRAALEVSSFDGRNWEEAIPELRRRQREGEGTR